MVEVQDKSYIAGIVDGEGSIILGSEVRCENRSGYRYTPYVQIANTNLEMLKYVQAIYKGTISVSAKAGNVKANGVRNTKDCYKWLLKGLDSKQFVLDMLPFLRIKKQQGYNYLRFLQLNELTAKTKDTLETAQEKHQLYLYNRMLNGTKLEPKEMDLIDKLIKPNEELLATSQGQLDSFPVHDFTFRDVVKPEQTFCTLEGCGEVHYGKGYCRRHYRHFVESKTVAEGRAVRECVQCGADINHLRIDKKYCSLSCKGKYFRALKKQQLTCT